MDSRKFARRLLVLLVSLVSVTAVVATPTPALAVEGAVGCVGGATEDEAWCCACNNEYCGKVEHDGIWDCPHSGFCESIRCEIGDG